MKNRKNIDILFEKVNKMKGETLKKLLAASLGLVLLIAISGCKKKTTPAPAMETAAVEAIQQVTCPVMGGAIDKNVFVEHQGKKVYFCCQQCKGEFEKDPEKYIAKLPQFAK